MSIHSNESCDQIKGSPICHLPTFLFWSFEFYCSLLLNHNFLLHFPFYHHLLWYNNFLFCDFLHCSRFNLFDVVSRNITSFFGCQTPEAEITIDYFLERILFECRNIKTKVNTLTNKKGHQQSSEPIKTQSKYMQPAARLRTFSRASSRLILVYF